ncbi:MAG TPA: CstA-like transporter-associated (seleno)protein [Terriglobia bacterium]|nr:CstA-like transporter-associated (seleno)protein [Terriglobia bacterium]
MMSQFNKLLRAVWHFLRVASGEDDYARYRARALHQGVPPMTPEGFYLSELQRKYSRPNRCC